MGSCLEETVNMCHFKMLAVCSEITKSKTLLGLEEIPKIMTYAYLCCSTQSLKQLLGELSC